MRLFETKKPLLLFVFCRLRDEEFEIDGSEGEWAVVLVKDLYVDDSALIDAVVNGDVGVDEGEVVCDVHNANAGRHCHVGVRRAADVLADDLEILEGDGRIGDV
eukprot:XP_001707470.1 Hypothetical protein GL50803_34150 [Giardia lamblia ATCC 50803]